MKNYIKQLLIYQDIPLNKTDYIVILSILWSINSFEIMKGAISILWEYLKLSNISHELVAANSVSVHFSSVFEWSIPWHFILLLTCIFFVRRLYSSKKSWMLYIIIGTLLFITFRCLKFIIMISLKGFWLNQFSAEGVIEQIDQNVLTLSKVFLPLGIVGLLFMIIKFIRLKNKNRFNQINLMNRERYAKIVLLLGITSYCIMITLISYRSSYDADVLSNEKVFKWFNILLGLIFSIIGISLTWNRLKDAGFSWIYLLIPVISGGILTLPFLVMIMNHQTSFIVSKTLSFVLNIGMTISFLFSLWLMLIPSKEGA